jgi:hypothetical protein
MLGGTSNIRMSSPLYINYFIVLLEIISNFYTFYSHKSI